MKKQTYTYQNFNREDLQTRVHTSLDWAIRSVKEINEKLRNDYENGNITYKELEKTVIGYIKGAKSTYCM